MRQRGIGLYPAMRHPQAQELAVRSRKRDPIGGAGKKGPTASSTPPPEESQKSRARAEEGGKCPGLMPLDFLLSVIRHPKTPAALQVKVSLATLPYIHPKQSSRPPKPAVVADSYGFEVDPALAKKLRNKIARLAQLNNASHAAQRLGSFCRATTFTRRRARSPT